MQKLLFSFIAITSSAYSMDLEVSTNLKRTRNEENVFRYPGAHAPKRKKLQNTRSYLEIYTVLKEKEVNPPLIQSDFSHLGQKSFIQQLAMQNRIFCDYILTYAWYELLSKYEIAMLRKRYFNKQLDCNKSHDLLLLQKHNEIFSSWNL